MECGKLATAAARALRRFEQFGVRVDREKCQVVFDTHGREIRLALAEYLVVWRLAYSESYSITVHDSRASVEEKVRRRLVEEDPIYRYQPVAAYSLTRGRKLKLNLRVKASV